MTDTSDKHQTLDWFWAGPCDFVAGAGNVHALPTLHLPEVAFAGRSNVGKSSLINTLTGRSKLARTSHTPGRTQAINFFKLRDALHLVDLPGYGYAKVSLAQRAIWTGLIEAYLRGRVTLKRVMVLVDSRRGIFESDIALMKQLDDAAVPYQIVLTKCDECTKAELAKTQATVTEELKTHPAAFPEVIQTSSRTKQGIPQLRALIADLASFKPVIS